MTSPMSDLEQLARETDERNCDPGYEACREYRATIESMANRIAELEGEKERIRVIGLESRDFWMEAASKENVRAEAAEAQLAAVTKERDELATIPNVTREMLRKLTTERDSALTKVSELEAQVAAAAERIEKMQGVIKTVEAVLPLWKEFNDGGMDTEYSNLVIFMELLEDEFAALTGDTP